MADSILKMAHRRVRAILPLLAALAVLGLVLVGGPTRAQQSQGADEILLEADDISYNAEGGVVAAQGNVEIVAGERILKADSVSYDQNADTVTATGNVSVLESDGTVLFASQVELSDQLKNGSIQGFRALLADDSRFAAASATRSDGNRTVMQRAVYSPCRVCAEDPTPLWRIRAARVTHDQTKQQVSYTNARLEMFGVPVLYTPYFSHPDPTVERKSGFLVPTQAQTTQLGVLVEVPYFFNIAPNIDATFSPIFTSKEGVVLGGEFRERLDTGQYRLEGSVTRPQARNDLNVKTGQRVTRSHLFAQGAFDWDDTWRWGFNGAIASDDTYLRRYQISDNDTLTSNAFVEGFSDRNYAAANGYFFQGLRTEDDPGETPLILPMLEYNLITAPDQFGGSFRVDSNFLSLTRRQGTNSTRLSVRGRWLLPRVGKLGDVRTLIAEVKADGYLTSDVVDAQKPLTPNNDGLTARLVPQLAFDWRLPLVRREQGARQVLEPIVNVVISPYGGNPSEIPNEDSLNFEFDDTNVFSDNRFPGIDRIEGGPRLNYGFRYGIYGDNGGYLSALLGQVLRPKADDTFADKTGLEASNSDFVGRVDISPSTLFRFYERVRLDRDTLAMRRNEITLEAGPPRYKFNATYVRLRRELTADELTDREEINIAGLAALTQFWTLRANTRRDLTQAGGTINSGVGLVYEDECFNVSVDLNRDFTRDRDVEPATTVSFRVRFKHLG
ncbi:MAG: LPS assembly protein LptD [Proteobacteria bacterium]|nr:LPS assembly protein LptD [Pseudomonadota bacterium]